MAELEGRELSDLGPFEAPPPAVPISSEYAALYLPLHAGLGAMP
ncbi:hypothetical protein QFZ33_004626 [Arthrobacter globiformis]|nr:hypothetical protein [Arthrobacter globiformis]